MIDLLPEHYQQVRHIFNACLPGADVRIFGSRIKGTATAYSDLDLVVLGDEPKNPKIMSAVKDRLSESDLPFLVDVLDWADLSESFRTVIIEHNEPLYPV